MKKIAISLPDRQANAIERMRRQQRIPRSRVIQNAIARYLAEEGYLDDARRYEQGYRKRPERQEAKAFAHAAVGVLAIEEWK